MRKKQDKLYKIYHGMKYRCNVPTCKDYKWYGAKGIKICDEWKDYEVFKEWSLKNGYKEGLSIDRLNPELGYSPDNCEWVTLSENSKRMCKRYNGSPTKGIKLTDEHKIKCSNSIKKRYNENPDYKLKIKHFRDTNGNTKITVAEIEHLKKMIGDNCTRSEMYDYIEHKVNRNYFNALIRSLNNKV